MEMTLRLSQYRPFDLTKLLIEATWDTTNWLTVAKSVAVLAITILPALIFDIAVSVASLISRCFYPMPQQIPQTVPRPPTPPPAAVQQAQESERRVPDSNLIDRVDEIPRDRLPFFKNEDFLRYSIQSALSCNSDEMQNLYRQLILHNGALEGREVPINIHQWCAGCLIAKYLVAYYDLHMPPITRLYPEVHPHNREEREPNINDEPLLELRYVHEREMTRILHTYRQDSSRREIAGALLQIMAPSEQWKLSALAQTLVNQIQTRAQGMANDPAFLEIYQRAIRNI